MIGCFATEAQSSQSPSLVDWLGFRTLKSVVKTAGVQTTRLGLCELCASVAKTGLKIIAVASSRQPNLEPARRGEGAERVTIGSQGL